MQSPYKVLHYPRQIDWIRDTVYKYTEWYNNSCEYYLLLQPTYIRKLNIWILIMNNWKLTVLLNWTNVKETELENLNSPYINIVYFLTIRLYSYSP